MKKTLAIIGAGDLGQQIAHYAIVDNHYNKVVFFDDFITNTEIAGHKVLGKIIDVQVAFKNNIFDELLIGIGYKHLNFKKEVYNKFENKIPFGKLIHSTCWIDETVKISPGCIIYPKCIIDAHVTLDCNTIVNINCSISHHSSIAQHCFLSPRVAIAGFVKVGELSIIGINATLIDNINIAPSTQIGGGAVVVNNILTSGLYFGNPAKFIR
ncbi:acetyltransferase [Flavobacterium sp.]|uniref:acetyltransferase n=1 Tax=Flavobacterium sp. TaxID=239 RepID=UPI0025F3184C|nr:acetyltransferase [Flavobacterium sp.]